MDAVLRQERHRCRLSQAQIGLRLGVSESTVKAYESGARRIQPDLIPRMVRTFKSARVALGYCGECPANLFVPPYLEVDRHPVAAIQAILEEAAEACEAVRELTLRNKTGPGHLTDADRRTLERAIDQVLDLIPLAVTVVDAWCSAYGLDLVAQCERHRRKLSERGYVREEAEAA